MQLKFDHLISTNDIIIMFSNYYPIVFFIFLQKKVYFIFI
jgi:hypothetical protein